MGNIEKHSKIKKELLSKEFYFQSFLEEAYKQGELDDEELENIQMQCIRLLADSTQRYNKGESSSINIEAAQAIMASNFYTMGMGLKALPDTSSMLDNIKTVSKLYERGRKMINAKLNTARHLYQLVSKTKIQSPGYAYNATIEKGIKSFFKNYNADFEAHETPASIDYQLMNPVTGSAGVEYMVQYLQSLYVENLFCLKFDAKVIHEVMCGYDKNYKDLLLNIFGQVLQNALGCMLLDKEILSLDLMPSDIQKLKNALKDKSKESIHSLLQQKAGRIVEAAAVAGTALKPYIFANLSELASTIYFAADNDTLHTIFVTRYNPIVTQNARHSTDQAADGGK